MGAVGRGAVAPWPLRTVRPPSAEHQVLAAGELGHDPRPWREQGPSSSHPPLGEGEGCVGRWPSAQRLGPGKWDRGRRRYAQRPGERWNGWGMGGMGRGTSILPGVGLSAPLESSHIASHRGAGQKRSPREMVTARGKGAICVWCALPAPFTRQLLSRLGGSPDLVCSSETAPSGGQPGLPSRSLGRLIFFNP